MMKLDEWETKIYVVMFVYGTVAPGHKSKILLTNATTEKEFRQDEFEERKKKIALRYQL